MLIYVLDACVFYLYYYLYHLTGDYIFPVLTFKQYTHLWCQYSSNTIFMTYCIHLKHISDFVVLEIILISNLSHIFTNILVGRSIRW